MAQLVVSPLAQTFERAEVHVFAFLLYGIMDADDEHGVLLEVWIRGFIFLHRVADFAFYLFDFQFHIDVG